MMWNLLKECVLCDVALAIREGRIHIRIYIRIRNRLARLLIPVAWHSFCWESRSCCRFLCMDAWLSHCLGLFASKNFRSFFGTGSDLESHALLHFSRSFKNQKANIFSWVTWLVQSKSAFRLSFKWEVQTKYRNYAHISHELLSTSLMLASAWHTSDTTPVAWSGHKRSQLVRLILSMNIIECMLQVLHSALTVKGIDLI